MSEHPKPKIYIYELPFDIEKELCRLLDNDDLWKDLAGNMKYKAFEVNEIEQTARRLAESPTRQLLTRWGQLNHNVDELFVLLYKMKHIPALNCIKPLVRDEYIRLLNRSSRNVRDKPTVCVDVNGNKPQTFYPAHLQNGSESLVPVPVILIEQGQLSTTSRRVLSSNSPTDDDESTTVDNSSSQENDRPGCDANDEFIRQHVSAIPMLKYEDLKEATNNWSESNLLGRGGFGQVFKGEWKLLTVAVKRLQNNDVKKRELIREMCLNQYRHDNILPLYGYSLGGAEACLVYQLMAGGSLEQRLRLKTHHPALTWAQRHRIAHGVARGLQFLHTAITGKPLIHGDIKPANILLDQCTIPKIGDFGLARKGPYGEDRTHLKVSRVHGTAPYLPNEYLSSHCLSMAVDVFSFGVVLVQIATALPAMDQTRTRLSDKIHRQAREGLDMATLEDRLVPDSNPALCREIISLGVQCTHAARHQRPTMLHVYKKLDAMSFPGKCVS